ncbi:MAG: SCO family protein [Bryobacteraceae bacterium]|jgi:protein SCO1/2
MRRFVLVTLLLTGCAKQKPLEILGEVPPFQLTNQQGRPFDRSALDGHVWIADFIFTTCQASCPRMSARMRALEKSADPSIRFVSFTVDPDNDTPPVLAAYGKRFDADDARWAFLTGDKTTLNTLDRDAFKLSSIGTEDSRQNAMDHSTRFVLIDKKERIRGYYGITDDDSMAKISSDAKRLEKEPA